MLSRVRELLADPIMLKAISKLEQQGFRIWADSPEITLENIDAALAMLEQQIH